MVMSVSDTALRNLILSYFQVDCEIKLYMRRRDVQLTLIPLSYTLCIIFCVMTLEPGREKIVKVIKNYVSLTTCRDNPHFKQCTTSNTSKLTSRSLLTMKTVL